MTATAQLPPVHAPYQGGTADDAYRDVRALIEHAIVHQPRSLQKRIGPSELGTPCQACLAAKLAGWQKNDDGVPWLPTVGTAVHALFSEFIIEHENDRNATHTTGIRWLSEQTVTVGHLGDTPITGSVDLFDTHTGTVIDFKVVGASTLRNARRGPSEVYRTQVALYAHGYAAAGYDVRNVGIWFVPRNSVTLNDAIWWHEPYDPARAVAALERANQLHTNLTALQSISTEARDAWITSLPRDPGCWDCPRWPGNEHLPKPGHAPPRDQLAGLIAPASNTADGTPAA